MPSKTEYASCQSCGVGFFREPDAHWKRLCLNCFIASKKKEQATYGGTKVHTHNSTPKIDQEMLRRLIQLCHPDKHNNSQSSVLATQWLLKMKEHL